MIYFVITIFLFSCTAFSQSQQLLKKNQTILLPNVKGRIDHMSIDLNSNRLFVAALGSGSVEVIDLRSGKDIHSITRLEEPQGVLYYAKSNLLFITSAEDGTCKIFNASNYKLLKIIYLGRDADNIRFDSKRDIVFVGYGSGGIAAINPFNMKIMFKIDLPDHPESFQIDEKKNLMFVNIPGAAQLELIDIHQRKVIQRIRLNINGNFPMALDTLNHLIFIGSRNPSKLVIFNETPLKKISKKNISGDADDIYYDNKDSLIFVSCGSGYIDVFKLISSNEIILKESIKTSSGARTSLYVPALNKLFIAARKYDGSPAYVTEFSIRP